MSFFDNVRKIDLFGKFMIFEEKEHQKFTTVLGTIFTFLIILTCIVIGFLFGQEVYQRKNPTVLNSYEKINESRISLTNFPLFFAFVNGPSVNQPTAKDYIRISLTHSTFDSNFTPTVKFYYDYITCDVSDYSEFYQPYVQNIFNSVGLGYDLYCINYTDELYIQNDYASASSSYVNVNFDLCDEALGQCGDDPAERKRLISDLYIVAVYVDSYIDSSSYKTPKNYYTVTNPVRVGEGILQRHFMNIQRIDFIDNKGWLLEDKISEDVISIKSITKDVSKSYNNALLWVTLSSPNIRSKIERSYMKIQDTLAKIGGFFNALYIIIFIISKDYVDFSFYKYIYSQFSHLRKAEFDSRKNIFKKRTIEDIVMKLAHSNLQSNINQKSSTTNKEVIVDNKKIPNFYINKNMENDVKSQSNLANINFENFKKGITTNSGQENQFAHFNSNNTNDNEGKIINNLNSKVNINNYVAEIKKQDSNNYLSNNINNKMISSHINNINNINNKINDNSINNSKIQFKAKDNSDNNLINNNGYNINRISNFKNDIAISTDEINLLEDYTKNISYFKYFFTDIVCCKNKFTYQRKAVSKIISFENIMEVSYDHFIKHDFDLNNSNNNLLY